MKKILITFALAIMALTACRTQIDPTFLQIPWQNPTETHILLYTQAEGYYHHFPFDLDSLVIGVEIDSVDWYVSGVDKVNDSTFCFNITDRFTSDLIDTFCMVIPIPDIEDVGEDWYLADIYNEDSTYCFVIFDRIESVPVDTICTIIVGGVGDFELEYWEEDLSGDNVIWRVIGGGANSNAVILPKGTGAFQLDTAGNVRGERAIDLQMNRSVSNQVASGEDSGILGGIDNRSSGIRSFILSGSGGISTGTDAVIIGGANNQSTGTQSLAWGQASRGTATRSVAMGQNMRSNHANTWVIGMNPSPGTFESTQQQQLRARFRNGIDLNTELVHIQDGELQIDSIAQNDTLSRILAADSDGLVHWRDASSLGNGGGNGGGYTIYETDSVFTSDRTADLDGNYLRFTNGTFAIEGGGNNSYTEPTGGYFVFNPDSGAIRAGARVFEDAGMPLGSINLGEDNRPGQFGIHIGAANRSLDFLTFGRYASQILVGYGNIGAAFPGSFAIGESNELNLWSGGGDVFLPVGALGWDNLNEGNHSIVIGAESESISNWGGTFGRGLKISNDYEIALGRFNTTYAPPPFLDIEQTRIFSLGHGYSDGNRSNGLNVFRGNEKATGVYMNRFHFNPMQSNDYPDHHFKFTGRVQVDSIEGTATRLAGWTADNVLVEVDFDSIPSGNGNGIDSILTDSTLVGDGINVPLGVDTSVIATKYYVDQVTQFRFYSVLQSTVQDTDTSDFVFFQDTLSSVNSPVSHVSGSDLFTILEDGFYEIKYTLLSINNNCNNSVLQSFVFYNGSDNLLGLSASTFGTNQFPNLSTNNSTIVYLEEDDTLQLRIGFSNSCPDRQIQNSTFKIRKIN